MKILKNSLIIIALLLCVNQSRAQFLISYPTSTQDLTVCQPGNTYRVRIDIIASTSNDSVAITFPPGVGFNPLSLTVNSASGMSVTFGSLNGNIAKFSLGNGPHTVGQFIDFQITQLAGCTARTSSLAGDNFKNQITVYGSGGSVSENNPTTNSYNVKYPSIVMTAPLAIINATGGTNYTRNFSITNGSATCTSILRFYLVYPNGVNSLNSITFNGIAQTPSGAVGDTLFFTLTGSALSSNGQLCNGQSVAVVETLTANTTCGNITYYGSSWGCGANVATWCQLETTSALITPVVGVPNYTAFTTGVVNFVNKCTPITVFHRFTNGGTGNTTQAGMYDVFISIGQSTGTTTQGSLPAGLVYSDFRIGGNPVPITIGALASGSLNNFFTSDPDGPGGIDDLDGDGYYDDLPGGQSFTVTSVITFDCTLNFNCGSNQVNLYVQNGKLTYTNICGELQTPSNRTSNGYGHREVGFSATGYVQANVTGGTPFQVSMNTAFSANTTVFNTANTIYVWTLTLPPGVSVASTANATYGTTPTTYTQVGNVVTITSPNATFKPASINLIYPCGVGGSISIPYTLDKINDNAVGCSCDARLVCGTFITNVTCPSACSSGVSNYVPTVRRSNFALGWTTTAMTTRQIASNISSYDLSKALYLDTILITSKGRQNGAATNMHLELELDKVSPLVNKLSPVSIFVSVYRGGALLNQAILTTSSSTYSTAVVQSINWDLSSVFLGGVQAGDSVVSISRYVVATNAGLPQQDVQSGKWMRYYNLNGAIKSFCGEYIPEMYLVGTTSTSGTNAYQANGCTASNLGGSGDNIARRFNSSGTYYQNEFRPVIYIDSFDITLNSNYTLENLNFSSWQSMNGTLPIPTALPGNVYRFRNTGNFPTIFLTITNTYGASFQTTVRATCATNSTEIINRKFYIKDYYYAHQGLPTPPIHKVTLGSGSTNVVNNPPGFSTTIVYNQSSKPSIDLINQTGVINAYTNALAFNLRVNSVGTTTAPYVWFAIPSNSGILVNTVIDNSTSLPITGIPYPGGRIYQVSTLGIASGTSKDYTINATLISCTPDSLKLYSGWNCGSYPASPTLYTCSKDSLFLKVIPQITETQISFVTTPPNPLSACVPLNYQAKIQNVGGANYRNTRFLVNVPNGLTMGVMQAEYPSGSGTWVTMTPSIVGSDYSYSISSIANYPVNGIPGTVQAPTNASREVNVRWTFTIACNFASGSSFTIKTRSDNPCGSLVQGSNVPINSTQIQLAGITSPYAIATASVISAPNINCNSLTTISAQSTVIGGITSNNATLQIILPLGFTYFPGSLLPTGVNPPTFNSTTTSGGIQTILLNLPGGVVNGGTINYSFQITGSVSTSCGSLPIEFQSFEQTAAIPCITETTGFCASSQVQTGSYITNFDLLKPNLIVTASTGYQNAYNSGQFFTFYTLQNQGTTPLLSTNPFTVDYYCANGSGNPTGPIIASKTHSATIAINGTASFSDTLSNPCGNLQNFVAVISNTTNCVCNSVQRLYSPIVNLGVELTYFEVEKNGPRSAKAKWQTNSEQNSAYFQVERSFDLFDWKILGTKDAAGNSEITIDYSFDDNTVSSGLYYYRLKQFDLDGEFKTYGPQAVDFGESNMIQAIPNPSSNGLFTLIGVSSTTDVTVFDAKGMTIYTGNLNVSTTIDLSRFDSGIYIARILEGEKVTTLRLVKK